jgi:hypothetical protein
MEVTYIIETQSSSTSEMVNDTLTFTLVKLCQLVYEHWLKLSPVALTRIKPVSKGKLEFSSLKCCLEGPFQDGLAPTHTLMWKLN